MNICTRDFKDVRVRRETFFDYCGVTDAHILSNIGFFHLGGQILCCAYCNQEFITWDKDMNFFWQHRGSNCQYFKKEMTLWKGPHQQTVENWTKKPEVISIIESKLFTEKEMQAALKDFLNKKGNYSSIKMFRNYLKNFSHNV